MENKYFMHRIQKEDGEYTTGIEVHDTKESAILSFWGRMKLGYGNPEHPNMTYVSCKIKDAAGNLVDSYNLTWSKDTPEENTYFMHYVRENGETIEKNIDVCSNFDAARLAYSRTMEYGYGNTKFPNVDYVSCEITSLSGSVLTPFNETWIKMEPEIEPEPETEPEEA